MYFGWGKIRSGTIIVPHERQGFIHSQMGCEIGNETLLSPFQSSLVEEVHEGGVDSNVC